MRLLWKENRSVIVDFPLFLQELDLSMENTSDDISLYYSLRPFNKRYRLPHRVIDILFLNKMVYETLSSATPCQSSC